MTYKGPEPKAGIDVETIKTCEGCTTPRKCVDMGACCGVSQTASQTSTGRVVTHDLKCWPEFFCPVRSRLKTFEIRKNDRDYKEGDRLYLREFIPCPTCKGTGAIEWQGEPLAARCDCFAPHGTFTGRQDIHTISYVMHDFPGLMPGYVALGLSPLFK